MDEDQWMLIESMNSKRRGSGSAALPDGIYVAGGFDGFTFLDSFEKYDISNHAWKLLATMKLARYLH